MLTLINSPRLQAHHIDAFDGIRGVAILLVLSTHGGWCPNGWVGVDLFFVLSGFLITGILRRTRQEPFYWRRFYIKRVTRILPPLLLGIVVTLLIWPHLSLIGIAGYALSLGNVVDVTRFSIFPIRHLWSLSVEEHYYFLWPLAVLWLPKKKLQWLLCSIVVAVPLGRLVFTYLLPHHEPNFIYFLTPFRVDGIALGSLLGLLLEEASWQERLKKWSGAGVVLSSAIYVCLRAIFGHRFRYDNYSPIYNSIGYSFVALISFFVIAYACLRPNAIPTRILRSQLLTKLGVISYGLYVYSWILMVLITRSLAQLSWVQAGLIHVTVAIPLSAILFKYYERPITDWGRRAAARLDAKADAAKEGAVNTGRNAYEVEKPEQASIAII